MSKIILFLALLLLPITIFAEEVPFENPTYTKEYVEMQERKLEMVSKIFPKTVANFKVGFEKHDKVEQFDGFTFTTNVASGREELTITADIISDSRSYSRGWYDYEEIGAYSDFYIGIEVQLVEQKDNTKGWFFFQYTDTVLVGEENRQSVEITFPTKIDKYFTTPSGDKGSPNPRTYTTLYDLSSEYGLDDKKHTLEMIRFAGYTSCYIDHHFIVGFEDEFEGVFYPLYGVGIEPGGEEATFAINNLVMSIPLDTNNHIGNASSICIANKVNVRQEPSQSAKSIGQINSGTPLTVLSTEGEWSQIDCSFGQGYIKTQYILQLK